jgi:hypothetical protein
MVTNSSSNRLQELKTEMLEAAMVHCRGLRKIAKKQVQGIDCALCYGVDLTGYVCETCNQTVCISCFPMAFQSRVSENDAEGSIEYKCTYCNWSFASFPQVSVLEEPNEI